MLVVLDTNVVASGFLFGGHPEAILVALAQAKLDVVASPEILWEYEATLRKLSKKHPEDDKFLSCALSADATWIVSGDKDLLVLNEVEGILIVNPAAFVKAHPALFRAN